MSRKTGTINDERAALKEEIKQDMRADQIRRRLLGCGGCFLLTLLLIGLPAYFLAATVAKTGLAHVPGFSSRLYHAPEPSRDVLPLAGTSASALPTILAARAKFDPQFGTVKLTLSEVELTTLLSQSTASLNDNGGSRIKDVQTAIEPEYIELFMVFERKSGDMVVRARFMPIVANGKLDFEVREILLGSYKLPQSIAKGIITFIGKAHLDALRRDLTQVGSIERIDLEPKLLRATLRTKR